MNNTEVLQDFRRRWEGTYVWLSIDDKRTEELVYLDSIEASSTKVAILNLTSDRIGKLTINFGSEGHSLQFRYPPVGVYQCDRDAYAFYRRPARQYRRGICADNSMMVNTTRSLVGNRARWLAQEVRSAFDHNTHSITTALTLLENGYKSVALDSNFSLSLSMFDTPEHVLFHWIHPVARVNNKGVVTHVYEPSYKELINQLGFNNG